MLLVIRGEKVTSTRIPSRRSQRHIGSRKEFRITVLLFTLSCSWSVVVIPALPWDGIGDKDISGVVI